MCIYIIYGHIWVWWWMFRCHLDLLCITCISWFLKICECMKLFVRWGVYGNKWLSISWECVKSRAGWCCTCPSQASFSSMMQKGPHPRSRSRFMIDLSSTITDSGLLEPCPRSYVPSRFNPRTLFWKRLNWMLCGQTRILILSLLNPRHGEFVVPRRHFVTHKATSYLFSHTDLFLIIIRLCNICEMTLVLLSAFYLHSTTGLQDIGNINDLFMSSSILFMCMDFWPRSCCHEPW